MDEATKQAIKQYAQRIIDNGLEVTKDNIIKVIQQENEFLIELVKQNTERAKKAFGIAAKDTYLKLRNQGN